MKKRPKPRCFIPTTESFTTLCGSSIFDAGATTKDPDMVTCPNCGLELYKLQQEQSRAENQHTARSR